MSIQQFFKQNESLAVELKYAGCQELSEQKRMLANIECDICTRLKGLFQLAKTPIEEFSTLEVLQWTAEHSFTSEVPAASNQPVRTVNPPNSAAELYSSSFVHMTGEVCHVIF